MSIDNKIDCPTTTKESLLTQLQGMTLCLKEEALQGIINVYSEKWRIFHNVSYLQKMFLLLEETLEQTEVIFTEEEIEQLHMMIIFHRHFYKFGFSKSHGALESAKMAKSILIDCGRSPEFSQTVFLGINFVNEQYHKLRIRMLPHTQPEIVSFFSDLYWLSRYGRTAEEFKTNLNKIEEEKLPILTNFNTRRETCDEFRLSLMRRDLFLTKDFEIYNSVVSEEMSKFIANQ